MNEIEITNKYVVVVGGVVRIRLNVNQKYLNWSYMSIFVS